jgi:CheY-like chemotaxis protein
VLYVAAGDDDGRLALRAFSEAGFPHELIVARGAAEAEAYLNGTGAYKGRNRLVTPLMLVIDLTAPGLDGAGLLRRVRQSRATRHIVAVLLTGTTAETERLKSVSGGNDLFAEKPAGLAGFLVMARQMTSLLSHHAS